MVQLAHTVGLQQGRLGQRQFAALEVLLTQAIAPVGVESEVAHAIRGFDALVKQLPCLRHTVLAGAQGGQLDQDLRQEVPVLRVQTVNRTLDPLGGRVEFAEFGIERRDVYVENRSSAVIVGGLRLVVRLQKRL
jgi:hypothetical protein